MSGNELGPVSRSLVDAARGGLGPDPGAAARVRAKVAAAITGGGLAAAGSTKAAAATAGSTAAPAAGGSGLAIKLAIAVLVGGAIVGGVVATRGSQPAPPLPIVEPAATIDERPAADVRLAVPDGEPVQPAAERPAAGRPDPGRPDPGRPATGRPAAGRPDPGQSPSEILGQEVRLIDQAATALRESRFDDALAAIQIYDENIGERGQLTEDAAAIQIEATCRLHGAAADRLAEFDRKWPSSAQRARLAAACATH